MGACRRQDHGATIARTSRYVPAAMRPDAGIVRIHAQTMRCATPQRTADRRRIDPTPMIAPVMVCVVLTGIPKYVAMNSEIEPAVSAAVPPIGCSFVIFDPIVWMMRHP